jgi:hypothetical protein
MRYSSTIRTLAVLVVLAPQPLRAQEPAPTRPGTEELRRRVRERLAERVRQELALNDDQMTRLRATMGTYGAQRQELAKRQRAIRDALANQLKPGIAARPDSVARLTDDLMALRVRYAQTFPAEQAELARYLDPVQRAKITILRDRLLNRAQEYRHRPRFLDRRPPPE